MTGGNVRPALDADGNTWTKYWVSQGMSWRTDPDISLQRKRFLARRRKIWADAWSGTFPFKDIKLTRADVEWLLATHRDRRHPDIIGPLDLDDPRHRGRVGLDLRGADLRDVNLQYLPLSGIQGGLHGEDWIMVEDSGYEPEEGHPFSSMTPEQVAYQLRDQAAIHLEGASLAHAHFEHAHMYQAHLEGARLYQAHLDSADLGEAHLEGAFLQSASLEGASLVKVAAEGANFTRARLTGASLERAWLYGADFTESELNRANLSYAHLSGARMKDTHLEGARFTTAYLAGIKLPPGYLASIRRWNKSESWRRRDFWGLKEFPEVLPPADLQLAHFDDETRFDHAALGSKEYGGVTIADARWSEVNLALVDWAQVVCVGEEREARTSKNADGRHKDSKTRVSEHTLALRANRQLSVALREQGLSEDADRFAYSAQVCKRRLLLEEALYRRTEVERLVDDINGVRPRSQLQRAQKLGQWFWSWCMWLLAGYGYKPVLSLFAYIGVIALFMVTYHYQGAITSHVLTWREAFVVSMTAFHGRGFFPDQFKPGDPQALAAAVEAFVGLVIEVSFIATFTQRFFAR